MLAILFAIAPAIYAWNQAGFGTAFLVFVTAYGVFVVYVWVQSRKVEEIDLVFDVFREDLRRKVLSSQVVVPSIIGWPLAWVLTN